eukprot:6503558-Prymnesium_polylepis.1
MVRRCPAASARRGGHSADLAASQLARALAVADAATAGCSPLSYRVWIDCTRVHARPRQAAAGRGRPRQAAEGRGR